MKLARDLQLVADEDENIAEKFIKINETTATLEQ
jgi:hypothetical protein